MAQEMVPIEVLAERLGAVDDPVLQGKLAKALGVLSRSFALYRPNQLALSFNGGKDSTVLLHLLRLALHPQGAEWAAAAAAAAARRTTSGGGAAAAAAAAAAANGSASSSRRSSAYGGVSGGGGGGSFSEPAGLGGIHSFYFERPDDFQEVRDFVRTTDSAYRLGVAFLDDPDFNAGLRGYLEGSGALAIVLGTRRGDPNAEGQEYFCPSSDGWPPFMRINPVLDWTYHDVWTFLRAAQIPYCVLYDQGYTSLGGVHNTLPNSALKKGDGSFAPAHMLADGRLERAGRATKARRVDSLPASLADVAPNIALRAGLVVVGDEILSGKVTDVNTPFLCRELRSIGWVVSKVVMVPDEVAAIAQEVALLAGEVDVVLTSGGVGPTLDDVTVEAVAQAFGTNIIRNPEIEESLMAFFGDDLTEAHLKMADTPEDFTTLLSPAATKGASSPFPIVKCKNVYMLPGVPHLLQKKWGTVRRELEAVAKLSPFGNVVFRLDTWDEAAVAPLLDVLASEWGGEVAIGSYPVTNQPDGARLLLALESKRREALAPAAARLRGLLPPGALLGEQRDVTRLTERLAG
ncbi:FAD synthase [Raphidocelis subcapitata]|uniref:FAD synthase n=1 Tax=Raphidocelis subcapitata TaxID=307507 RepID=A0A2V0PH58_9CHLO|nr:FAD synthase [Raphidocelis subcapitata]|eukprot:GBF98909.1 FAD synthase [Raphidocelis subcapitata]